MGYEYKAKVAARQIDKTQAGICLRAAPGFTTFDEEREFYVYREPSNSGEMPNVIVRLESDGFYICNFGGSSEALMKAILRSLEARFGAVQIEDYEP